MHSSHGREPVVALAVMIPEPREGRLFSQAPLRGCVFGATLPPPRARARGYSAIVPDGTDMAPRTWASRAACPLPLSRRAHPNIVPEPPETRVGPAVPSRSRKDASGIGSPTSRTPADPVPVSRPRPARPRTPGGATNVSAAPPPGRTPHADSRCASETASAAARAARSGQRAHAWPTRRTRTSPSGRRGGRGGRPGSAGRAEGPATADSIPGRLPRAAGACSLFSSRVMSAPHSAHHRRRSRSSQARRSARLPTQNRCIAVTASRRTGL